MQVILKNATRMNRITEDLLTLASVESPDYKLKLQPSRASALVQDAIESLRGMVVDSRVKLESAGAPEASVMALTASTNPSRSAKNLRTSQWTGRIGRGSAFMIG